MSWILQGNPDVFDVDSYVSQYPFVYWSAPMHQKQIAIGDDVFIWRSGKLSGAIARGRVGELPTP